jgi:hypothetical protein
LAAVAVLVAACVAPTSLIDGDTRQRASKPPQGATWTVAPWGSDAATGSPEDPFASLRPVAKVAAPGDTVLLRGGVYDRVGVNAYYDVELSGAPAAPITIRSFPGERAVIDGGRHLHHPRSGDDGHNDSTPNLLRVVGDHLVFEDMTFRYGVGRAFYLIGYHNVLRRIVSHHHHSDGIYLQGSYNLLEHIESFGNNSISNGGNSADGIKMVDGNHIRVTHGSRARSHGNVVRYALLYGNSDDGLDIWNTTGTVVEYSIAYGNGLGDTGNGVGFKVGGGQRSGADTIVRFNVGFGNHINFDTNGSTGVTLYHNTSVGATNVGYVLTQHRTLADRNMAYNNISYGDRRDVIRGSRTVHSHNSWNLGIEDPDFVTLDERSADFLALDRGSPAIDAGMPLDGLEHRGPAPDLGALQWGERRPLSSLGVH